MTPRARPTLEILTYVESKTLPRVIVLVPNARDATTPLTQAVATGAAHVRFTEVDVRAVTSGDGDERARIWRGVDELRDCDGVVLVSPPDANCAPLADAIDLATTAASPGTFANTVFAIAGRSEALLARVAALGGIIVTSPTALNDGEGDPHALGQRVSTVVEWVRHARSHEHGHTHSHSHHHHG